MRHTRTAKEDSSASKHKKLQRFGRGDPDTEAKRLENLKRANSKPRSKEYRKRLSESLKAKWASGTRKPTPPSAYKKASATRKKLYAEGRIKLPPKEVRIAAARKGGKTVTPYQIQKNREIAKARKGQPGTGGCAKGERNAHAHRWKIRCPRGKIYTFTNLREWARNNEHLFLPDARPNSKKPLCERIGTGIGMLFEKNGRCCSYRGWTAVSRLELVNYGDDLLGRDTSPSDDQLLQPSNRPPHQPNQ